MEEGKPVIGHRRYYHHHHGVFDQVEIHGPATRRFGVWKGVGGIFRLDVAQREALEMTLMKKRNHASGGLVGLYIFLTSLLLLSL